MMAVAGDGLQTNCPDTHWGVHLFKGKFWISPHELWPTTLLFSLPWIWPNNLYPFPHLNGFLLLPYRFPCLVFKIFALLSFLCPTPSSIVVNTSLPGPNDSSQVSLGGTVSLPCICLCLKGISPHYWFNTSSKKTFSGTPLSLPHCFSFLPHWFFSDPSLIFYFPHLTIRALYY